MATAESTTLDRCWCSGATEAEEVIRTDRRIDRALDGLRELADTLRASFALPHAQRIKEERDHREGLLLTLSTAAVYTVLTLQRRRESGRRDARPPERR